MKFIHLIKTGRQNIFIIQFRWTGARVPNLIPIQISNEDIYIIARGVDLVRYSLFSHMIQTMKVLTSRHFEFARSL